MSNLPILLVEDDPDHAELTVIAFRRNNLANEIHVARDGAEALDYLFGSADKPAMPRPALVILDLHLPKVMGIDVLRKIRNTPATALLPVVVLTTSDQDQDVLASYSNGCNAYMQKPVSFNKFVDGAATLGMFWLMLNVTPPIA